MFLLSPWQFQSIRDCINAGREKEEQLGELLGGSKNQLWREGLWLDFQDQNYFYWKECTFYQNPNLDSEQDTLTSQRMELKEKGGKKGWVEKQARLPTALEVEPFIVWGPKCSSSWEKQAKNSGEEHPHPNSFPWYKRQGTCLPNAAAAPGTTGAEAQQPSTRRLPHTKKHQSK